MTRHLPLWARIEGLGREHIFGVCVVTFDTWHLAILFDLVQGIMLASPGNEGSMAVIVCFHLSPILLYLCSYANFRAFFRLFYWFNSVYMPNARVSVCTVRQPAY